MSYVLQEITSERTRQDQKWGGPEHDDEHTWEEWRDFMDDRVNGLTGEPLKDRELLVQLAALAVARVESLDRIIGNDTIID